MKKAEVKQKHNNLKQQMLGSLKQKILPSNSPLKRLLTDDPCTLKFFIPEQCFFVLFVFAGIFTHKISEMN